jgi:pimeloyl-ACP methyl ester carboxylesterase
LDSNQQTYVVAHGWNSGSIQSGGWQSFLESIRRYDAGANILFVDWTQYANTLYDYRSAANDTDNVGGWVADYLTSINIDPTKTTLIGHSLGGHVIGNAGAAYQTATGNAIATIMALDPAGPLFEGNTGTDDSSKLSADDAERVIVMHSTETLGYNGSRGDLDLYLNDWTRDMQPGTKCLEGLIDSHNYPVLLLQELFNGQSFAQNTGDPLSYDDLFTLTGDQDVVTEELNVGNPSSSSPAIAETGVNADGFKFWTLTDFDGDGDVDYEDLEEVILNGLNGGNGFDPDQFGLTRLGNFITDNADTITVTEEGFNLASDYIFYIDFDKEFTGTGASHFRQNSQIARRPLR